MILVMEPERCTKVATVRLARGNIVIDQGGPTRGGELLLTRRALPFVASNLSDEP